MRLSHERIIPYLNEGVIADAEEQMVLKLEIDGIKFAPMQGLHFYLNSHFNSVIPSY